MSRVELIVDIKITQSERKVIELLAIGLSNRDIATQLELSIRTVESHVSNMLGKAGLHNRTELAYWAIKNQLV